MTSLGQWWTGRRVAALWCCVVLATGVLPGTVASTWHRWRVSQSEEALIGAARAWAAIRLPPDSVTCGGSRQPGLSRSEAVARGLADRLAVHEGWIIRMRYAGDWGLMPFSDGWGQCLVIRVEREGPRRFVVSAGANGLLESPLDVAVAGGDDLVAVVR